MIDTKTYQLTKKTYLNIHFDALKKNTLDLIPFVIIWSFLLSFYAGYFLFALYAIVLVLVGFILLFWFLFKNLKPFFTETHLQFDLHYMYLKKNTTTSRWSFARIKKVINHENHWLLYLSKREYVYVPKDIFYTVEDKHTFKTLLNV